MEQRLQQARRLVALCYKQLPEMQIQIDQWLETHIATASRCQANLKRPLGTVINKTSWLPKTGELSTEANSLAQEVA